MHPNNPEAGKWFVLRHGFKVCMGTRYLGGYIRDNKSKHYWMKECMETLEKNIITIRKTAGKYTQESYSVVVRTIQP